MKKPCRNSLLIILWKWSRSVPDAEHTEIGLSHDGFLWPEDLVPNNKVTWPSIMHRQNPEECWTMSTFTLSVVGGFVNTMHATNVCREYSAGSQIWRVGQICIVSHWACFLFDPPPRPPHPSLRSFQVKIRQFRLVCSSENCAGIVTGSCTSWNTPI